MKETVKLTLGQQLSAQRKKSGLTQAKLSQISGISLFAITALEQGKSTEANTYTLRQLGKALNFYRFEL